MSEKKGNTVKKGFMVKSNMSGKRFCLRNIENLLKVKIPDVNGARSELRRVLGVIISSNDFINYQYANFIKTINIFKYSPVNDNFNEIDTTEGKLQQLYSRNQFRVYKKKCVQIDDGPNNLFSLRETARAFSNLGEQGYDRCTGTQLCKTNTF